MIHTQRRVHAGIWSVLGLLLLVMFAIAMASRPDEPPRASSRLGLSGGERSP